jgi:hypothetical protein
MLSYVLKVGQMLYFGATDTSHHGNDVGAEGPEERFV